MRVTAWAEVPSERRYLGVKVWATGAEIHLGRRMWRARLDLGKETCLLLRRHDPITIVDKGFIDDVSITEAGINARGRITEKHDECARCKARLADR